MIMAQDNSCVICGRASKRDCPAHAAIICPACCGSRRGVEIECPAECVHFPFGTAAYDLWLKVDGAWQPKALDYVLSKVGKSEFERKSRSFAPSWDEEDHAFVEGAHAALQYYLVMGTGENDRSLGEQWKAEGWSGLNNDERYMTEYRAASLPGILEMQKVLDDTRVECLDLLDAQRGRFIVFDRSTAGIAARFDRVVVWITHYPHFSRVAGTGVHLTAEILDTFLREMRARARKALGRKSDETVKRYMAEHFGEAFELVAELGEEMRQKIIASIDADRCLAFYTLRVPRARIEAIIEEKPDFEPDAGRKPEAGIPSGASCYVWLRRGETKVIEKEVPSLIQHGDTDEGGVGILGSLWLTDEQVIVETMGRKKFHFANKLLRRYFGRKLKHVDDEITPIESLMDNFESSNSDRSREPIERIPRDVEERLMREFFKKRYINFLDEPVPMIGNVTPREAAREPAMRPKLMELMKLHLNHMDQMCSEKGFDINIDWVLDELGLDELK